MKECILSPSPIEAFFSLQLDLVPLPLSLSLPLPHSSSDSLSLLSVQSMDHVMAQ